MPSATSHNPLNTTPLSTLNPDDLESFTAHLGKSTRILVLCGAGLSASSGLPTFRGAGGYWRTHDAISLATPEAFEEDPSLVWQFYNYRRHMAFTRAAPNPAHYAIAELARRRQEALCVSQNVDGFHVRAKHPEESLALLHGSLSTVKCADDTAGVECDYVETGNFRDPIVPALQLPPDTDDQRDISDASVPLQEVKTEDLPQCPKCQQNLLRPGVVWFGESLPTDTLAKVEAWMADRRGIDLLIVVGTSASVYPAAGYIQNARRKGARVAVVNTETPDTAAGMLQKGDWFFRGDAGAIMPKILRGVVGNLQEPHEDEKVTESRKL